MKSPLILLAAAALVPTADAAVILSETFGTATVNPTASTFTTDVTWNYSDSVDTTVNTNASRLFNPGGAGSGTNSFGWISQLQSPNTFQQIRTDGTFSGLPALNAGEKYVFTLTFFAAVDTSSDNSLDVNAYVNFTSAGKTFTFVNGSNGAITNATNFSAQTLADGNASADTVGLNFVAQAGGGGLNTDRTYTATWTSTDALSGAYSLALGRTSSVAGTPFVIFDNVSLDVSVQAVPEPSTYGLAGAGALAAAAMVRRRRKSV